MNLTKIPRNIFQTWETKNISEEFKQLSNTWIAQNPNYAYFLYDDKDCLQFIKKHFDITIYNAFNRIIPGAFKADLWRYCILYIYGGVYVDIDTICYTSIDLFLNDDIEFMTPIDLNNCFHIGTHNLFNAFIASIPKHPILLDCINRIVHNVENNIIPSSNLDFTGPGILGRSVNTYLQLTESTSFIGKHGCHDNNKILLLHFEPNTEYVKDINNRILFQNKNGNPDIQEIYNKEIKLIHHIDWGKCVNPIKSLPTIVTMIYNIREKENNSSNCEFNHKIDKYLESAMIFILKLPFPLIIFTDIDDAMIDKINQARKDLNLLDKTFIYKKPFENTYFYKDLDKITEIQLQGKFRILNGVINHETPMYVILNNNKFGFIENAIELNPFNSTHFIWMDFGINHVAQNTELIHEWITHVPDKIKQLCINPYLEPIEDQKQMFQNIYHHTAGGLFSGSKENLLVYSALFKQKTQQIYDDEWYQIDEAVMTMVQRENENLFEFFYGDYQGIISNYISPINNIDLILSGVQKCLDYGQSKKAYDILCYCIPFFETNVGHPLVINFIIQHLIVDYYHNNQCLLDKIVWLINTIKKMDVGINALGINALLINNMDNINFYNNKELIL